MSTCRSITIPLWPTYVLPTSECDLLLRPNFDGPKRHEKVLAFFSPDLVDIFSSLLGMSQLLLLLLLLLLTLSNPNAQQVPPAATSLSKEADDTHSLKCS